MSARGAVATAGLLIVVAFGGASGLGRFYDDWALAAAVQYAFDTGTIGQFVIGPFDQHWSPGWWAFEALNEALVGWRSDALIRAVTAALVGAQALVAWAVGRRLGFGRVAALVAMGLVVLHPVNAAALYSFDTYAQVAVNLIAWSALSWLLLAMLQGASRPAWPLGGALAALAGGLLLKEQALAIAAGLAAVAAWFSVVAPASPACRRALWATVAGAAVIGAAFAALRMWMGLWMDPDGPYAVCLTCVPGNIGLLAGGVLLPMQTLDVYLALRDPGTRLLPLAAGVLAAGGAATMLIVGLVESWRRDRPGAPRAGVLGLLLASATFPVVILSHVGELYANALVFWLAMLAGLSVEGWRARLAAGPPRTRRLAAAWTVLLVLSLGLNQQLNLGEMRRTGERAEAWLARFDRALAALPPGSGVLIRGFDDLKGADDYSLYRLTTPSLLLRGQVALEVAGRPDLVYLGDLDPESLAYWRQRVGAGPAVFVADIGPGVIRVRAAKTGVAAVSTAGGHARESQPPRR